MTLAQNMGRIPHVDRSQQLAESYGMTNCMSLISGAWAAHVIWHLRAGPRRFGELRLDIPRLTNRVLSQRLKELEARGIVSRTIDPLAPMSVGYYLTPLGHELVPALRAIVNVGLRQG